MTPTKFTSDGVIYRNISLDIWNKTGIIGIAFTMSIHGMHTYTMYDCSTGDRRAWKNVKEKPNGGSNTGMLDKYYRWGIPVKSSSIRGTYIDNDDWDFFVNDLFSKEDLNIVDSYKALLDVFSWSPKIPFIDVR